MTRRTPFLVLAATTVACLPPVASASPSNNLASFNAGYAGLVSAASPASNTRRVAGTCSFQVVPLGTLNQAVILMEGAVSTAGTQTATRTSVTCEFIDDGPDNQRITMSRSDARTATAVNGSQAVVDNWFKVCVTSEALYGGIRVTQARHCWRPTPDSPLGTHDDT